MFSLFKTTSFKTTSNHKHPKCKGHDDTCDYEPMNITCDQCKYTSFPSFTDKRRGKNPEAKCNQPKELDVK